MNAGLFLQFLKDSMLELARPSDEIFWRRWGTARITKRPNRREIVSNRKPTRRINHKDAEEPGIVPALLAIILTASQIVSAVDSVPKFDVERTCLPVATMGGLPGRDAPACRRNEQDARNQLKGDWSQYSGEDRSRCVGFVGVGGPPSYVELLTCLEMAKHAKSCGKNPRPRPLGAINPFSAEIVLKKGYTLNGPLWSRCYAVDNGPAVPFPISFRLNRPSLRRKGSGEYSRESAERTNHRCGRLFPFSSLCFCGLYQLRYHELALGAQAVADCKINCACKTTHTAHRCPAR